jgi:hypothetical protein
MLSTQLPLHFPKVKAVVWFNWDNDEAGIDWPIETSAVSKAAFARSIASGYYATNSFARLDTAPIPALGQAPASLAVVTRLPMIVASTP